MKTCTFFGHRDCPPEIRPLLYILIDELIEAEAVEQFYVGCQGRFDDMVLGVLRQMQQRHPSIRYAVVLEKLPGRTDIPDSIFPEGLELAHPRYAIDRRNRWMISQSNIVITHVTHSWGGACRYAKLAQQHQKHTINLDHRDLNWMWVSLLERSCRIDAHGTVRLTEDQALEIMRLLALKNPHKGRTAQESWELFQRDYRELIGSED